MKLEIGKFYKIVLDINNNLLTYLCTITDINDMFVSFIDKFDEKYTFNINKIVSYQEVDKYKK
jgi:hypothetical protein